MIFLEISNFFGRLHPLLVHLPIGFLILAVVLSSLQIERNTTLDRILRLIWLLSFISALFSALMGWLLAQNGHYIQEALSLHQWTGIALVFFSALGWIFNLKVFNINPFFKKINNGLIVIFLFIVGHLGGTLTHGDNYLYEFAPEPIKSLLISESESHSLLNKSIDSIKVFNDLIQPLFSTKCVACHNDEITRGGLNMSSAAGLFKGGKSGSAIIPNDPKRSLAFTRVIRSQYDQKFMPPTGIPLTYEEIQLLEWWINTGASTESPLSKSNPDSKIQYLLMKKYALDTRAKPWYEKIRLEPLDNNALVELEQHNFSFRTLSVKNSLLDIRYNGTQITEKDLEVLEKFATHVTWLNLSESQVQKKHIDRLSKMINLTRLSLQKNPLETNALYSLTNLDHLEVLNLHSTQVDNRIFDLLQSISSLKKVFLWDTKVSSTQLKNKLAQFDKIEIIGSSE